MVTFGMEFIGTKRGKPYTFPQQMQQEVFSQRLLLADNKRGWRTRIKTEELAQLLST